MSLILPDSHADLARRRASELGMTPEDYLAFLVATDADPGPITLTDEQRRRIGDVVLERIESGEPAVLADEAYWEALRRRIREGADSEGV